MEETYEEVRLALGAACSGAGLPAPTLPPFQARVQAAPVGFFRWAPRCTLPCVGPSRSQAAPGQGEGWGKRVFTSRPARPGPCSPTLLHIPRWNIPRHQGLPRSPAGAPPQAAALAAWEAEF